MMTHVRQKFLSFSYGNPEVPEKSSRSGTAGLFLKVIKEPKFVYLVLITKGVIHPMVKVGSKIHHILQPVKREQFGS